MVDAASARRADTDAYGAYFRHMLQNGCYFAPAQFEAIFLSNAHQSEDIERTLEVARAYFTR